MKVAVIEKEPSVVDGNEMAKTMIHWFQTPSFITDSLI